MRNDKTNLNPKEYDYLWSDYDINFIFTSCYLFKEFRKQDIVLIYGHEKQELKFFLSKASRKSLSAYGIKVYGKEFSKWKEDILKNIKKGEILVSETEKERDKIGSMDDSTIKSKVHERAALFQSLGGDYFYTEFFVLDNVEKIAKKNDEVKHNLEEMGKIKLEARDVLNKFYNYRIIFSPYIKEISKRFDRDDLEWLSFYEIKRVIEKRKVPISRRGNVNWVLSKKNGWNIFEGKEADIVMQRFDKHFFMIDKDQFKGLVANKGYYKGTVKIIRTIFSDNVEKEIQKVQKGDVLIAATTGPEVMSACQKAGAIVTDEGGMTSHAAIVSRELGIPCIVGTKVATKVFKDGDLVEVDANKGIVRKIK